MTESLQAVVMAGGEGSRLRPLTSNMPKPMLPVVNRPLMEHTMLLLRRHGVNDVVVTVQYLSSVIRNYFGDGSDVGLSLSYSTEDVPLGTAGSVLNARDLLSGTFLVISGDALTDIDLSAAIEWHRQKGAAATIVLKPMQDPLEFGVVMTADDGRVERFLEKPGWGQVFSDTVNTGIYVLEPEVLDLIPPDQPFDFSSEVFPQMLAKGLGVFGYTTKEYWTDVGNTDAYLQAHIDVLDGLVATEIDGFELLPGAWVGEDAEIDPSVVLNPPLVIGNNCRVGAGATLGPHAVLGDNVMVGREGRVRHAVVMDRGTMGALAHLDGGVLGLGGALGRGATVEEGAVVGDEVSVGAGALIKPHVKVYPSRTVESGAIVTQSVVRERRASRSLFGVRGVTGQVNVGVTPQVAVRLGMAYGSTLTRPSTVVTGRDASRAARTLKRALIAGLNSTGVTCHDLELMPMPITRFLVRSEQASGGISVRTSPRDPEMVEIRLFGGDGADIPEAMQRKIDRVFFRDDYRRPGSHKLGELEFPPHAVERYAVGLLKHVDAAAIRKRRPKVVVDYAYGPTSLVGPSILGRLGVDALSLRAFTDEARPVVTEEALASMLEELADHVRNSGSDLGVVLEPGGEVAHLVDDRGRTVGHRNALLALLQHQLSAQPGVAAVPVSSPSVCEELAKEAGGRVYWTSTGLPGLMAGAARAGVTFAGNSEGTVIFPGFLPAPDGTMTFCKTLELLAVSDRPLAETIDALPAVFLARATARTPSEHKGTVMRTVASRPEGGRLVLYDGVKILYDDRWVLVVPSPDEPICYVWAEAGSQEDAETLAARYADVVEEVVASAGDS
ncbi:MAG: sugar phosphate nucleotidyltransferase [Actinomycetota bacterium]|nr:sugar phosphate nucleotidyltransferase [Actinomycetota bacterium]